MIVSEFIEENSSSVNPSERDEKGGDVLDVVVLEDLSESRSGVQEHASCREPITAEHEARGRSWRPQRC